MSMAPASHRGKHYALASDDGFVGAFRDDLDRLGADGFADWLKRSFCGPDPSPVPGWFHSDVDALFGQLFRQAEASFDTAVSGMALRGITAALADFNPAEGTLYGLLELTGIVEAVRAEYLFPKVAQALRSWFDPNSVSFARGLSQRDDVIALREILECAFRLRQTRLSESPDGSDDFKPLADWACEILLKHPHALRRSFVPAYAPMYMLALGSDIGLPQRSMIETVIESGWRTADEPFPALFVFSSTKIPNVLFPYDYDRLTRLAKRFFNDNRDVFATEQDEDPFGQAIESATHGIARSRHNDLYALETLQETVDA